jgi:hypothetical protein
LDIYFIKKLAIKETKKTESSCSKHHCPSSRRLGKTLREIQISCKTSLGIGSPGYTLGFNLRNLNF